MSDAGLSEGAAVAQAVEAYEQAWRAASYDAFVALVTPALAAELGVDTAGSFAEAAADHGEGSEGLTSVVTGIDVRGDAATVVTTETSRDGSDHVVEKVIHRLVLAGETWRIDSVEIAGS